jgi:hypothetical protein
LGALLWRKRDLWGVTWVLRMLLQIWFQ